MRKPLTLKEILQTLHKICLMENSVLLSPAGSFHSVFPSGCWIINQDEIGLYLAPVNWRKIRLDALNETILEVETDKLIMVGEESSLSNLFYDQLDLLQKEFHVEISGRFYTDMHEARCSILKNQECNCIYGSNSMVDTDEDSE